MMATAKEPNGVATITRPDCACYARRLIAGGAALFLVLASVLTYLFIGATDIAQRYAPLVDAAMEIKLEATTAHLWLEEILGGDRQEDINEVWRGLERADWYAGAMLDGARNAEGHYLPLRDPALHTRGFPHQPHEGRIGLSAKFRPLLQNPVVITGRKEIARIEARGQFEIARRHGALKPQHVDLARPG